MLEGNLNGGARFKDQVSLVVGDARGIGKAIVARLAGEGAAVVIADIDIPMMNSTVAEMCAKGFEVRGLPCDVRDSRQVDEMVGRVLEWYARIDVLMYISGITPAVPFLDL